MKSKEEKILSLFFEHPTREWHFEELVKQAKIARSKADGWLKKFQKEKLIARCKPRGCMPYYVSNYNSPNYKNTKRLFAMTKLHQSGLLNHLISLPKVKSIILFGSLSRSDWHKGSDIDIFIYGNPDGLKIAKYELKLRRDIQLFICENKNELPKIGDGLIKNVIKGNLIKGNLDFVKVSTCLNT